MDSGTTAEDRAGHTAIIIRGADELTVLYQQAAGVLGMQTEVLDPNAAVRALARLGAMLR